MLFRSGIAAFRTPESCADAIRAWRDWRAPAPVPAFDAGRVAAAGRLLAAGHGARLDERQAGEVFEALGVPRARFWVLRDPQDLPADMVWPVVAKVLSPDIAHKTEAGGVRLDVRDATALRAAYDGVMENAGRCSPSAALAVLVQEMVAGGIELIVGVSYDVQLGPMLMVGIGGVMVELYREIGRAHV